MRLTGTVCTKPDWYSIVFPFLAVAGVLAPSGNVQASRQTRIQIPEVVGEYFLSSANSQALPALVSESGTSRQEVIGGSIRLEADGTYLWTTRYRYTDGGRVDESESSGRGSYTQEGTGIIFLLEVGEDRFNGALNGNTLTVQTDVPMLYRKIFGQRPTQPFTQPNRAGEPPPPSFAPNAVALAQPLDSRLFPNSVTFALPLAAYLPGSFEELCDSSTLIVEAQVQSVLAPRQGVRNLSGIEVLPQGSFPIFQFLETDSILQVDQVLKGPESIRQVVISQKGGVLGSYTEVPTQYSLMQQGEHYILFLSDETQPGLPDVAGIPRYALTGVWTGLFQIDDSGVLLSPATAEVIREQFDGRSPQDVISEIQQCS